MSLISPFEGYRPLEPSPTSLHCDNIKAATCERASLRLSSSPFTTFVSLFKRPVFFAVSPLCYRPVAPSSYHPVALSLCRSVTPSPYRFYAPPSFRTLISSRRSMPACPVPGCPQAIDDQAEYRQHIRLLHPDWNPPLPPLLPINYDVDSDDEDDVVSETSYDPLNDREK